MDKIKHDLFQIIVSGPLDYGYSESLKVIEDKGGLPVGFKIDAKNNFKESVIDELVSSRQTLK